MTGWLVDIAKRFGLPQPLERLDREYNLDFPAQDSCCPAVVKVMRRELVPLQTLQ
ncbi:MULTISPECIES: hypothetical protein [Rhizobium]|uniref:Uncharacterized protein n=1 Tax=Rhizobium favelukesii TaxID=348824 RepID=W6RJJ9_9HYPH|nr:MULTISPECIES: hypothetical protein [Rhizobium]MCS0463598.1 hypothetical protein [Rhizobium favelukesii]UFS84884.1 hypothetical protein LPB79_30730 [Rhizobium sp. T136]CDM60450.1 hypothetical protein LPU83_pLPU83b_0467 [Rhizobium favelukesii]